MCNCRAAYLSSAKVVYVQLSGKRNAVSIDSF
jgi:hypothetical protein